MSVKLEIRITARCQNAVLARLVDEFGSIKSAAAEVGVSTTTLSHWLYFKTQPFTAASIKKRRARYEKLIPRLERLTGRNIRDIFPDMPKGALRLLSQPRAVERKVSVEQITTAVEKEKLAYEQEVNNYAGFWKNVDEVLKTLSYREREIIKLRFGVGGQRVHTLEEVGHIFKVTRERIRSIESSAIRKMQQRRNVAHLIEYLDAPLYQSMGDQTPKHETLAEKYARIQYNSQDATTSQCIKHI